jgi:hypothetical protein
MRISKDQLRQIIKEELTTVLDELSIKQYDAGEAAHTGAREATLDALKDLPGGKMTQGHPEHGEPVTTTDVTSDVAIAGAGEAGQTAKGKAEKSGGLKGFFTGGAGGAAKRATKKAVRSAGGTRKQARQAGRKAKKITKGVQKAGGSYSRGDYFEDE